MAFAPTPSYPISHPSCVSRRPLSPRVETPEMSHRTPSLRPRRARAWAHSPSAVGPDLARAAEADSSKITKEGAACNDVGGRDRPQRRPAPPKVEAIIKNYLIAIPRSSATPSRSSSAARIPRPASSRPRRSHPTRISFSIPRARSLRATRRAMSPWSSSSTTTALIAARPGRHEAAYRQRQEPPHRHEEVPVLGDGSVEAAQVGIAVHLTARTSISSSTDGHARRAWPGHGARALAVAEAVASTRPSSRTR